MLLANMLKWSSHPTNLHQLSQQQKWCMLSKAVWPYHSWGFWVLFQGGYLRSCKATPPLHPDGCIFISGAVSALHRETGNRTGHRRRAKQASWSAPNHRLKKCENKYIFKFNPHFAWGATTCDSKASKFILGDCIKIHQDYSLYYAVTYCVCCKMVVKMDKSSVATEKSRHTLYILHLKYAHLQSLLLYCQPPVGQWVSWPCPSVPQSHSANNKWVPLKIKSDKKELQKKKWIHKNMNGRDSPPCCHQVHPKSHRLHHHLRRWGRNFSETWGWSHESQAAAPEEVKKALHKKNVSQHLSRSRSPLFNLQTDSSHTMRAGAELGRQAKASLDCPLLKDRPRHREAGLVGFLNSKLSWKKKNNNKAF